MTVNVDKKKESLSTAMIARNNNILPNTLRSFLINKKYLIKAGKRYHLTEEGFRIGGTYFRNNEGEYWPVWPEESIKSLIKEVAWPVEIIGSFHQVKKRAREEVEKNGIDRNMLHAQLERGIKILESQQELDAYIEFYGYMHEGKLSLAYEDLNRRENIGRITSGKTVQIVDYACGQGVASMLFMEFLSKVNVDHFVDRVIFIEPSKLAIESCAKNFTGNIIKINKKIDDLLDNDILTTDSCVKFHLFSNILDMADDHFKPNILANKIIGSQKGTNYFVCVSPHSRVKLDNFMNNFERCVLISAYSGAIQNPSQMTGSKPWMTEWNIFKIELQ